MRLLPPRRPMVVRRTHTRPQRRRHLRLAIHLLHYFYTTLTKFREAVIRYAVQIRRHYINRKHTNLTEVVPATKRARFSTLLIIQQDGIYTLTDALTKAIQDAKLAHEAQIAQVAQAPQAHRESTPTHPVPPLPKRPQGRRRCHPYRRPVFGTWHGGNSTRE